MEMSQPNSSNIDQCNVCNNLMLSHVFRYLATAEHHEWACSAGSKGYCATKDMLQNGIPGHTLLMESRDLRDVGESDSGDEDVECCVVYTFPDDHCAVFNYDDHIPTTVIHLTIYSNCVSLPPELLQEVVTIRSLDLSPLSHVTEIHECFLAGCFGLASLDLTPLSNVTRVHDFFLYKCAAITSIDLSPLSCILEIPEGFLYGCTGLTSLHLHPLSHVTKVQGNFLYGCTGLSTIDLGPLSNITTVHKAFLGGCTGLTTLNLSPLSKVTRIEDYFLRGCTSLSMLDLSPLALVTQVGASFLANCTMLLDLDLSPLTQLSVVRGGEFLDGCVNLAHVASPPLSLCAAPEGWVGMCSPLTGDNEWVRVLVAE